MIIEMIMSKIWSSERKKFDILYNESLSLNENELVQRLLEKFDAKRLIAQDSSFSRMTIIPTTGCTHWHRKDTFSGCSFCDNFTNNIEELAYLSALKRKNEQTYIKTIRNLIERTRNANDELRVVEHITAHDSLCEEEIPFNGLFDIFNSLNKNDQMTYLAFETRACNVNIDKIKKLKKTCKRIIVECAMEVGNEWIRNHWLNKNVTDYQIKEAISKIHEEHCISDIDIILGLPGLNDMQSKELFIKSCCKAFEFGADYIVVSPLVRKDNNLSNILYKYFKNDSILLMEGVVKGEYTGFIEIITVYDSIISLIKNFPQYEKKIIMSPININSYVCAINELYINSIYRDTAIKLLKGLVHYQKDKDFKALCTLRNDIRGSEYETSYIKAIEKQPSLADIKNTLRQVVKKMLKHFYPESYNDMEILFEKELSCYSDASY